MTVFYGARDREPGDLRVDRLSFVEMPTPRGRKLRRRQDAISALVIGLSLLLGPLALWSLLNLLIYGRLLDPWEILAIAIGAVGAWQGAAVAFALSRRCRG